MGGKLILSNLFGISHQYNLANWYVYFYIYAMILLSIASPLLKKMKWYHWAVFMIVCAVCTSINTSKDLFMVAIHNCTSYTPVLLIGYYCANTQILTNASTFIKDRWKWTLIAIMAFIGRCVISQIIGLPSDIVFVPVFVIAISAIFNGFEHRKIAKALASLGSCSTIMWFIHTLPFNDTTRTIFQNSSFWPNNIIVLFLAVTLMSYLFALLYNKGTSKLYKLWK